MLTLAKELTESGKYTAVMVSAEVGAPFKNDPGKAELAILGAWRNAIASRLPPDLQPPPWSEAETGQRIQASLMDWAKASVRPLVIFIDEIDALGFDFAQP